ncbi:aminotransferase class III-fold pyridoxal phosphate-dependent enzyme [Streptococcus orisasini]|uniref:aminotransferase class III-fold pyridoxal phosphate-dependent enzyme n=1 Tax=Streptococcus orisasini TaxID=1080071 RepID=UPI0007106A81|nr:aminotransferase class III-fold pyridoxal phosphate-dependent enzyme [Streptococcus orisasini]
MYYKNENYSDDRLPRVKRVRDNFLIEENTSFRYLDLTSGVWNRILGNTLLNEEFLSRLQRLLKSGTTFIDIRNFEHPLLDSYSKKILDFVSTPNYQATNLFYNISGSEAVELAIKLIKKVKGRNKKILSFNKGFHGTTFGAMSISGIDEGLAEFYNFSNKPDIVICKKPNDDIEVQEFIMYLTSHSEEIGAIIIDPVNNSSGTYYWKQDELNSILKICKKLGIIIVFDEISSGFYKTGKRFAYLNFSYTPEILLLSKGLNNGILPLALCIVSEELENKLRGEFIDHFSTQDGNLASVLSADVALDFFKQNEKSIDFQVKRIEECFQKYFRQYKNYSGIGVMHSVHLNDKFRLNLIFQKLKNLGIQVSTFSYNEEGKEFCGFSLICPLTIEIAQLEKALTIVTYLLNIY